jgi:hypothetical protein
MEQYSAGRIDERGYLKGFNRRGFTPAKCLLEGVANSLDSQDKFKKVFGEFNPKIIFNTSQTNIKIMDNGYGMMLEDLMNMTAMHNENHLEDSSKGVSGMGAKPFMSILSKQTKVHIFSHMIGEKYWHATIPWNEIHRLGKYTNMITIEPMTMIEIDEFVKGRVENDMLYKTESHGTDIIFEYNDDLDSIISENFKPISKSELTNPFDRIGVVFGGNNTQMIYKHYENGVKLLDTYDYFKNQQPDYYKGKSIYEINHFYSSKKKESRFIYYKKDVPYEIRKQQNGFKNEITISTESFDQYQYVGVFTITVGLRRDNSIFDIDNPSRVSVCKVLTAGKKRGKYDKDHIGEPDENLDFMTDTKLKRNGQLIGTIPSEQNISSARADGKSYLAIILTQAEIAYNPLSRQDNIQDLIMGIQENKNQFDGKSVPKNLTRLARYFKQEKANEIFTYFEKLTPPKLTPATKQSLVTTPASVATKPLSSLITTTASPSVLVSNPATLVTTSYVPLPKPTTTSVATSSVPVTKLVVTPIKPEVIGQSVAIHVSEHRKKIVEGRELIDSLNCIYSLIEPNKKYNEQKVIKLFNLLNDIIDELKK